MLLAVAAMASVLTSCDDFLDIRPTGVVIAKTGEEYRNLLTTIYNNFPNDREMTVLRTDELTFDDNEIRSEALSSYFDIWTWNDITPEENTSSYNWRGFYHTIYIANYVIEHQNEITDAKADEIKQLVGECYMLRAYSHFVLVNLFGEPYTKCDPATSLAVPLVTKADVDAVPKRNTVGEIYNQILSDVDKAYDLMNVEEWSQGLTYRFNKISAKALRARVCLYMGRWQEAYDAAKAVVEAHPALENLLQNGYTMPDNYKSVEAIVSLEQVMKSAYKEQGIYPNTAFVKAYRNYDLRQTRFFKAKTSQVYVVNKGNNNSADGFNQCRSTFRSAEFYLTMAEAAAQLGNTSDAVEALTPLVQNRYFAAKQNEVISEITAMDHPSLITFVQEERGRELCFEGHRWFDLRRTTQPRISKTFKGVEYVLNEGDSRYTLPIPPAALNANPGLAEE